MAMNIINKEKKEIRWIGLPTNSAQECQNLEVSPSALYTVSKAYIRRLCVYASVWRLTVVVREAAARGASASQDAAAAGAHSAADRLQEPGAAQPRAGGAPGPALRQQRHPTAVHRGQHQQENSHRLQHQQRQVSAHARTPVRRELRLIFSVHTNVCAL